MQKNSFDYQGYLTSISQQIKNKLSQSAKLYLEVTGNLIDQSEITHLIPQFEMDTYKKVFSPFKYDMDILFCVKAQDIIDETAMGEQQKPFREFLQIYLKKIENQFGVKPHIVINLIDIENMYDMVFAFETHFQKLGYRVWEKHKIKAYSHDIKQVLSEDGFGNDDHIPTMKKLVLIAGLTPECGKMATAIAQIYLDQEIGIDSEYAKFEVLPNYSESRYHPINVLARTAYLEKVYQDEVDTNMDHLDLYDRGLEKHAFLQKVYTILGRNSPKNINEYILGTCDTSMLNIEQLRSFANRYLSKVLETSEIEEQKLQLQQLVSELK